MNQNQLASLWAMEVASSTMHKIKVQCSQICELARFVARAGSSVLGERNACCCNTLWTNDDRMTKFHFLSTLVTFSLTSTFSLPRAHNFFVDRHWLRHSLPTNSWLLVCLVTCVFSDIKEAEREMELEAFLQWRCSLQALSPSNQAARSTTTLLLSGTKKPNLCDGIYIFIDEM